MQLTLSLTLSALLTYAAAQQGEWQQCGGNGWTGATTCVSGTVCTKLNDWYFQCLPGTVVSGSSSTLPTSISSVPPSQPTSPVNSKTNFWFSFGDSYTQTGFVDTGSLPAIGNPLGNPPFPGYTAVGGTNWIDQMTVKYNNSLVLTYNYAYGGATIDASLVAPYEPTVLSLTDQVNDFLSSPVVAKPAYAPWTSSNALFSFWIGINDIGNSYYQSGSRDAFSDTLLNAYFALVEKLLNAGAKNFLFINVPPIDRSPLMVSQGASAQTLEASVIAGFNAKLAQRAQWLQGNNTGVTTWLWDSNAAFTTVLNAPTAYGFVDNTSYGNTGDFWGNNYHPSSAAQELWAQGVAKVLANTIW